jgi:hypothetical protein
MTRIIVSPEGPALITEERGDGRVFVLTSGLAGPQGPAGEGATTASTTEVLTGTDTTKAVTPDALAALWEKGSDIASAGTISIGEGGYFHVSGTTTITDIDPATDKAGREFVLVFDGVLTLTHNATTLILPTGANITTAAGDVARFRSEGSDVVRCVGYHRASGAALVGGGSSATWNHIEKLERDATSTSGSDGYATAGLHMTPSADIEVYGLASNVNFGIGTYDAAIYEVNSGTGAFIAATAISASKSGVANTGWRYFMFAAPVILVSGTRYALVTRFTSAAADTTPLQPRFTNGANTFQLLPATIIGNYAISLRATPGVGVTPGLFSTTTQVWNIGPICRL